MKGPGRPTSSGRLTVPGRHGWGSVIGATRAAWGAVLLVAPGAVLAAVVAPAQQRGRPATIVLRVLGARQLAQAAVERRWPRPRVLALAATVDALHAASGLLLATVDRRWRRGALLDAAVALGFCLVTARTARYQPRSPR